jgi:FAD/FMN-containing dehydrogenase
MSHRDDEYSESIAVTPLKSASADAIRAFAAKANATGLKPQPFDGPLPHPAPPSPAPPSPAPPRDIDPHRQPIVTCRVLSALADRSLIKSKNHFWQNWPKTHAYVAGMMCFPTSVEEIAAAVRLAEASMLPLRAVGGGWSFSDAALPGAFTTIRPTADQASALTGLLPFAEGFPAAGPSVAIIDPTDATLLGYTQDGLPIAGIAAPSAFALDLSLGAGVPQQAQNVCVIDTRSVKSSLQEKLAGILSSKAKGAIAQGRHYFHVEGGITIEELAPLLDAQSPRLVLEASGGNPGASIAGSISTGTHGAEFKTALLVDRVKAIHFVGPGGLQWWIEGDTPIADPDALMARYPCLSRTHIITGTDTVLGNTGQEWLDAVVVSMGCIGVIYSLVIEVAKLTGMREVVTQTTWWNVLALATGAVVPRDGLGNPLPGTLPAAGIPAELKLRTASAFPTVSKTIVDLLTSGSASSLVPRAVIPTGQNVYADLAFNPNRRWDGDLDCWIVNRNKVPIPIDPQPPTSGDFSAVVDAVFFALSQAFQGDIGKLINRVGQVYGVIDPTLGFLNQFLNPLAPLVNLTLQSLLPGATGLILGQMLASGNPVPFINMVSKILAAADKLDVGLEELTAPLAAQGATDVAQPLLTGILASTLGTTGANPAVSIGTSVGSVGFPSSGLVGAGLEVAMSEAAAFPFVQTMILDKMIPSLPFFGYVSVRICPKTSALMGMPQWNQSVMIEVVSYGDNWGRTFLTLLQTNIVAAILKGTLDATLHWGLENAQLNSSVLRAIPAMNTPFDRVQRFKHIRDSIRDAFGANSSTLFRTFDNAFTARLGL